ncbi:hypothetical protein Pmar_PMAR003640 [Perkinsus marinus ATCC 50983]|uniref:WW domain-containing protein n=1 Tax=Perkinsus marinus (strain ATCC 50983 / TXsc) TaxID=423536 RepID=C5KHW5_PERM5|nr:hypothetical protein Pmar_PMAR003640 [Perkinsus marinus ATCC 50983]EER16177.1 hypothetical protein Pmar_PMAR003640 [Perkinsus marinus ATCC 50983]|eukprot:XP_002784381.1 hypothetical protein Pmar_PMAR003640 [Perkinsus marinus ATCC 50983]
MLPYKRMLGLTTKVASIATMRHKVRMPVRVGDNETGGLIEAHRKALKPSSELSVEWHKFWWDATVKEVDPQASKVLVGFDAWDSRWDEWIPIDSNRLRERLTTDEAMHTSGTIESAPKKPSVIERRPIATVEKTEATVKVEESAGWEKLRADDGTPYYHNKATGHTQWEKPGGSGLSEGWQELKTDSGDSYYYNEATGVTQWERPGVVETPLPEGWEEFRTPEGTPYYHNEAKSETVWERPCGGVEAEELPVESGKPTTTEKDERGLPEGWQEFKADDGTPYYYNEATGVTQWRRPGDLAVRLPLGWEEFKADDGTPYYYNSTTGVTRWESPVEGESVTGDSSAQREESSEGVTREWQTFYADDGTPYYYNSTIGVTQWELPGNVEGGDTAMKTGVTAEALPVGWEEFRADDGTPYYYNSTTGVTQWELPQGSSQMGVTTPRSVEGREALPADWEEFNADDGTPYYYNSKTGVTQWEYPGSDSTHAEDFKVQVSSKDLPKGWEEHIAEDGTPYYHQLETGITQWEFPKAQSTETQGVKTDEEEVSTDAAEVAMAAIKGLPDGWDCVLTPEGRELFFREKGERGRTSTWSRPTA